MKQLHSQTEDSISHCVSWNWCKKTHKVKWSEVSVQTQRIYASGLSLWLCFVPVCLFCPLQDSSKCCWSSWCMKNQWCCSDFIYVYLQAMIYISGASTYNVMTCQFYKLQPFVKSTSDWSNILYQSSYWAVVSEPRPLLSYPRSPDRFPPAMASLSDLCALRHLLINLERFQQCKRPIFVHCSSQESKSGSQLNCHISAQFHMKTVTHTNLEYVSLVFCHPIYCGEHSQSEAARSVAIRGI